MSAAKANATVRGKHVVSDPNLTLLGQIDILAMLARPDLEQKVQLENAPPWLRRGVEEFRDKMRKQGDEAPISCDQRGATGTKLQRCG